MRSRHAEITKIRYFWVMKLSKKQWFGIITFIILLIAAYLVTTEPWKSSADIETDSHTETKSPASN